VDALRRAVFTPSERFQAIGVVDGDEWKQLSPNILQIENEFYSPIRPKQIPQNGETPAQALERGGIEYIEVRVLDVNPFSNVGIDEHQMRFIDLFLLYCLFTHSEPLTFEAQVDTERLVDEVVAHGRKPGLLLTDACGVASVEERLTELFAELEDIARVLDENEPEAAYQNSLNVWKPAITDPEQTLSGKVMAMHKQAQAEGVSPGMKLAKEYRAELMNSELEFYTNAQFDQWTQASLASKAAMEAATTGSFGDFLADYFAQAQHKKNAPEGR